MHCNKYNKSLILILIFCFPLCCYLQTSFTITPSTLNYECSPGAAMLDIAGLQPSDTVKLNWSTGQANQFSIANLEVGNYYVIVKINSKPDTTIDFKVQFVECRVVPNNHFTPNGDDINDTWQIGRTEYFPNFELLVFNKWGQQVHKQKDTYTPWDGTWNGIHVADGTYYYVFYYDSDHKSKYAKGDVSILR